MPLKDSLVTIPIDSNPRSVDYTVSGNPSTLIVDPGTWVLCKTTLHAGVGNVTARDLSQPLAANPHVFRNAVSIRYTLGHAGRANLAILDCAGRKVRTLAAGNLPAGTRYVTWDATNERLQRVAPGIYFCRLENSGTREQVKLVVTE